MDFLDFCQNGSPSMMTDCLKANECVKLKKGEVEENWLEQSQLTLISTHHLQL